MATVGSRLQSSANPARWSRRQILRGAGLAGVALGVPGCLSPTLPLPPPDAPQPQGPDERGFYRLTGAVPASPAEVFVLNYDSNQISGQYTLSGQYDIHLHGEPGDNLALWYTADGDKSSPVRFSLPAAELLGDASADGAAVPSDAGSPDSSGATDDAAVDGSRD